MRYSSATTSTMPQGNHVIQKPSSEISLDFTHGIKPHSNDLYVKFIILVLWMLSHASTPPLHNPKQRERHLDKWALHRLPSPCLESARMTQKLLFQHGISKNGSQYTAPPGLNVPLYIDMSSILTSCRGLGIRGGPKMQRLGQAITRRSQRISRSLRRSYLRGLRPGADGWPRALNIFTSAVNCKQGVLSSQSLPSHVYFIGSFILKHLARDSTEEGDRDRTDFVELLLLAANQYGSK